MTWPAWGRVGTGGGTLTPAQLASIAKIDAIVADTGDVVAPLAGGVGLLVVKASDTQVNFSNPTGGNLNVTDGTDAGLRTLGLTPHGGGTPAESVEYASAAAFPDPSLAISPEFVYALAETSVGAGDQGSFRKVEDAGVFSYEPSGSANSSSPTSPINLKTASYQLVAGDNGVDIVFNTAIPVFLTLPIETTEALPDNFKCTVRNIGTGEVTVVVEPTGTLRSFNDLVILEQNTAGAIARNSASDFSLSGGPLTAGNNWAIPTAINPMTAFRVAADEILVRTRTTVLDNGDPTFYDEFHFKDPSGYAGVDGGWQLVGHKTVNAAGAYAWLTAPATFGEVSNGDFALRFGDINDTYASGGEGPDYYFRGFGHGGMENIPANNQIFMDGGGPNLSSVANWAVDTEITGQSLSLTEAYQVRHPSFGGGATDIATINYTRLLDTQGCRMIGNFQAIVDDVGFNDSYVMMKPVSQIGAAKAFKPNGETAIALAYDGVQKGNWTTTTASIYQAYDPASPTIMQTTALAYGVPMRQQGGGLAGWGLNNFVRSFFIDLAGYPKLYVAGASSEQVLPRTAWPLPQGTIYEWQNRISGEYRAGGPQ